MLDIYMVNQKINKNKMIELNKTYKNLTREQLVMPISSKAGMVVYQVTKASSDNTINEFKCTTARFLNLYKLAK